MKKWILLLTGVFALSFHLVTFAKEDKLEKRIQQLIQKLGDESFVVREKATEELRKIGKPAIPYLKKALKSKDPEVQWRARLLLEQIQGLEKSKTTPKKKEPRRSPFSLRHFSKEWEQILRELGIDPKIWRGFFPRFRELEELEKELERFWRQMERPFGFGQRFPLPPHFRGEGMFRVWRYRNGKNEEEIWRFRNGRWEKVSPKKEKTVPKVPLPKKTVPLLPPSPHKLGVAVAPVPPLLRYHLGLGKQGVLVEQVLPGSRAEKAGIVKYDVILEVNGKKIQSVADLKEAVQKAQGGKLTLTILRQGKKLTIEVPKAAENTKPKRKFF